MSKKTPELLKKSDTQKKVWIFDSVFRQDEPTPSLHIYDHWIEDLKKLQSYPTGIISAAFLAA